MNGKSTFSFCAVAKKYLLNKDLFERQLVDEVLSFCFYNQETAIESGNVRALRFLKARGCVFRRDSVAAAVRSGFIEVLQFFVVDLGMGVNLMDVFVAVDVGVRQNDYSIIRFIIDNGLVDIEKKAFDLSMIAASHGEVLFISILHNSYEIRFTEEELSQIVRACQADTFFLIGLERLYPDVNIFHALDHAIRDGNLSCLNNIIQKFPDKHLYKRSTIRSVLMSESSVQLLDLFFSRKLFDVNETVFEIVELDYSDDLEFVMRRFPWIDAEDVFIQALKTGSALCCDILVKICFAQLYANETVWKLMDEYLHAEQWRDLIEMIALFYTKTSVRAALAKSETEEEALINKTKFLNLLIERDMDGCLLALRSHEVCADESWVVKRAIEEESISVFGSFLEFFSKYSDRKERFHFLEEAVAKDLADFVEVYVFQTVEGPFGELTEEEILLLIPKYRYIISYVGIRNKTPSFTP